MKPVLFLGKISQWRRYSCENYLRSKVDEQSFTTRERVNMNSLVSSIHMFAHLALV